MNAKLTLSLDEKILEAAEKYSSEKGVSLSEVVEDYLKKLPSSKKTILERKSSIMDLCGIAGSVPKDFDYKEERYKYLVEKHK